MIPSLFSMYKKDCRGQALVEAALVLPLLLFILFGIFVIGQWFNAQQVVTAAAREGARVGAQTGQASAIREAVKQNMKIIDTDQNRIVVTCRIDAGNSNDEAMGKYLTLNVTYCIPQRFIFFENEYAKSNPKKYESTCADWIHDGRTWYPFSEAVGQAVARLETYFDPRQCDQEVF